MKKILFTALTAITIGGAMAQSTPFINKTCYRGAFAPAPTPMWTDNWTEWNPQTKVYPAATMTVATNITSNTTWSTGAVVLLSTQCFVKGNSILTIQPGVIVLGDKNVTGAGLFITTGSKLIANGTVNSPIVFTSNQPAGQRGLGDWGGVILLGLATNNSPAGTGTVTNPAGTNYIEGLPISADTQYGGTNDNDNSGSMQYCRIEYGGYVYQPNKEINGLTFGAVGRGTTIDYIQVSYSNDDAFEWFGGTVNCKHLIAYRCLDDDWDTDNGFSGQVQFCLGVRDPAISDLPAISTSEGFESDNDPNGTISTPLTSAIFCNVTDIGPLRGVPSTTFPTSGSGSGFRRGARIRRNSNLKIYNTILMDHVTRGVYIDGALCEGNANSGALKFQNNILAGYGQKATETGTFGIISPNANAWVKAQGNDTLLSTTGILVNPYNYFTPDYRPAPGSIALSGASFTDAALTAAVLASTVNVSVSIPNTSVCIGFPTGSLTPLTFSANATVDPGYCSLSWSAPAGLSISSTIVMNPSFTVSTLGTFVATLSVTHADVPKTSTISITTYTCNDVGIRTNETVLNEVSLIPNPSNEKVTINVKAQSLSILNINVYDITGKLATTPVQNQIMNAGDNQFELNTQNLHNGIYFVTLETLNGKETVKLIVNH